jgi:hypothetical protein
MLCADASIPYREAAAIVGCGYDTANALLRKYRQPGNWPIFCALTGLPE